MLSKQHHKQKNQYDKDTFLQILVAQMKYQNPIEPESNTEYISQYATFSQIEQLTNLQNAVNSIRADLSVGKTVTVEETSINGNTTSITGKVEKVNYKGGVPYVSICGNEYLFDNVKEILDDELLVS